MKAAKPETPLAPGRRHLALFAAGDFAFNLYWQSVMLYLLYYYTEALHLPIAIASACYAIASVWDGIANLAVGVLADRYARPERFRFALIYGAFPLGLSFALAYAPSPLAGTWQLVWVVGGHLLFRSAYALVNVPYLAMSARISIDSSDRALVAGGRMLCGTIAAVVIALGTVPLGRLLTGSGGAQAYAAAAIVFAVLGSLLLIAVGLTYRDDGSIPAAQDGASIPEVIKLALRNRAFLSLCAAVMAMIVAVTVLDKSVLYYFKYALGDEDAGQLTLGWMMAISGAAVPLWVLVSRFLGVRAVWFVAVATCMACLTVFIVGRLNQPLPVQIFLVAVQGAIVGLHFAFWALLPDTVEYGQRQSGVRAEAVLYGLAAFFQRLAIGLGTLLVGFGLGREGLHHGAASDATYRLVLALIPLGFFALAGLFMIANPLRRGSHEQILVDIAKLEDRKS